MGGGCGTPIAALGAAIGERLTLRGLFFDNGRALRGTVSGNKADAEKLGEELSIIIKRDISHG
jgi:porphobilinogen deaminase